MKLDRLQIGGWYLCNPLKVAILADLHGRPWKYLSEAVAEEAPDMIMLAGDISEGDPSESLNTLRLLCRLAELAPTFYSLGNHERRPDAAGLTKINKTGAVLLDDTFVTLNGIAVGGLTSGYTSSHSCRFRRTMTPSPDTSWLTRFSESGSHRILLSHHPEYYERYLRHLPIDLILSGHAHGGQVRLFGRGLFAPGQGFFPRYTSGIYDGRLAVSRGLSNTVPIPRFMNPTGLILLTIQ